MAEGSLRPSRRTEVSTLFWATRSFKGDYRKMQLPSPSMRHGSPRTTPWLATIGVAPRDFLRCFNSRWQPGSRASPNKPCNFPAAKIPIISGLSRLLCGGRSVF